MPKREVLEQVANRVDAELRKLLRAKRTDAADELNLGIERDATVHRAQSLSGGTIYSTRMIRDRCVRGRALPAVRLSTE